MGALRALSLSLMTSFRRAVPVESVGLSLAVLEGLDEVEDLAFVIVIDGGGLERAELCGRKCRRFWEE